MGTDRNRTCRNNWNYRIGRNRKGKMLTKIGVLVFLLGYTSALYDSSDDVVELTAGNFNHKVIGSDDIWLVEFYAPWCGHCKSLAPEWKKAASALKGIVKVGACDMDTHSSVGSPYNGGRTSSDIVQWALGRYVEKVDPPEIMELTSNQVLVDNCQDKPLCVITIMSDILESGADKRHKDIEMLKELGDKYKQKMWGWVWTSAMTHPSLEKALDMGGFGYPALAVANLKKKVFVLLTGSFGKDGIDELLRSIAVGRGRSRKLAELPTISDVAPWDGKDGEMPVEEDIDLSDVELDDLDEEDKKDEL